MHSQTEWWQTFFTGPWLEVHGQIWDEERTRTEADLLEKLLRLPPQAKVLDVPCGEGRLSRELAARGYRLTGVDITAELLADARRTAEERQLAITWEHRDMRDLPWTNEFQGAFCFWGSFGYFDEEGNRAFVQAVARSLAPRGRFVIDTHVAETLFPRFQPRGWNQVGDVLIVEERSYDHARGRIDAQWTFIKAGEQAIRTSSLRLYTYHELCRLLAEAGFTDCEGYGSLDLEPFQLGSRRLYLVATKSGTKSEL